MKATVKDLVKEAQDTASPYVRHLGIFNPHKHQATATVVGCGAIGSFVAVGLAKMGVKEQELYDFDTVDIENLAVQLHERPTLGQNKAEATKAMIARMCPEDAKISTYGKWEGQKIASNIVVSAVDSLDVRKAIWQSVKHDPTIDIVLDARIGGQAMKIYAVNPIDPKDQKEYDKSLESTKGSELPCTERGVIDVSLFASALLIRAARRWLVSKKKETYRVVMLDADFPNIVG